MLELLVHGDVGCVPGLDLDEQLHRVGLLDEQVRSRHGSCSRHGSPSPLLSGFKRSPREKRRAEGILCHTAVVGETTTVIIAVGHHGPAARFSSARSEGGRADLTAA